MNPDKSPGRVHLWFRFFTGLCYLALAAAVLKGMTGHGFLLLFLAVLCGALFSSSVLLFLLAGWALRDDSRPGYDREPGPVRRVDRPPSAGPAVAGGQAVRSTQPVTTPESPLGASRANSPVLL